MNGGPEGRRTRPAPGPTATSGELHTLLSEFPDVVGFLQQLAALSAAMVPGSSSAVTMQREDHVTTVASSDDFAGEVTEIEYDRGQGPCLQALRTGHRVKVPDLATDDRWGAYRLQALAAGVRSCVCLTLAVDDAPIGALNLYSRVRNGFDKKDIRRVHALALQAANALTLLLHCPLRSDSGTAHREEDLEELRIQLAEARDTLRTIRAGGFDALVIDTSGGVGQPTSPPEGDGSESEGVANARRGIGQGGQAEQDHKWYRLVSLESFIAGCPCGWVSPERDTAEEMMRDVERHLDEVRRAGTAPP